MVLIGIQPFASKKIFLLVAALLCLTSAICFADSLFMSLHSSPYGRQLNRRQPVPFPLSRCAAQPPFLVVACQSLDGRFAQDSGWIIPEALVPNPATNWLAHRSDESGDHSYVRLCSQ
jgi:hypothetical protein